MRNRAGVLAVTLRKKIATFEDNLTLRPWVRMPSGERTGTWCVLGSPKRPLLSNSSGWKSNSPKSWVIDKAVSYFDMRSIMLSEPIAILGIGNSKALPTLPRCQANAVHYLASRFVI
jgi:hypothetical protein